MKNEFNLNFQKKLIGIKGGSIIRGTNPSMSHVFENKFTDLLFEVFREKDYLYLVDINLSLRLDGAKSTYRPDILVVEKGANIIKAVFELKIDDARASDEWVEEADKKLNLMKEISKKRDKSLNRIKYNIVKIDELGEPITNRAGKIQVNEHTLSCSEEARVACIALCKENSRKKPDEITYRTTGEFALYLSKKHLNNHNHTLDDLTRSDNLSISKLKDLIEGMRL